MNRFRIRTIEGAQAGYLLGASYLLFEIEQILRSGARVSRQYGFNGFGSMVGFRAGAVGKSEWDEFQSKCSLYDFEGYAILDSMRGGPFGMFKLSFASGKARGLDIISANWGTYIDASISFMHGRMRQVI